MFLAERHFIKGNDVTIKLCEASKRLYNKCNYILRNEFAEGKRLSNFPALYNRFKADKDFKAFFYTRTSGNVIKDILDDWKAFKAACRAYKKNPAKFRSKPKPPNYKKRLNKVTFDNMTISPEGLLFGTVRPKIIKPFSVKSDRKFKQVVIIPKHFGFIISISYEKEESRKINSDHILSIDLGVNNLASITSDQHSPLLINGRIAKSFNQQFNKKVNKKSSRKRYFRLENYFHHVSKLIINLCLCYNISRIIIGRNKEWKQEVNLGKVTNQNFVYIPFFKLIQKIQYKAKMNGIEVILTEESYTSKSSYLDRDPLVKGEKSGERIKRGLYKSKDGTLLNADINVSANISRKVIQNDKDSIFTRLDRSLATRPVKVNPLRTFNPNSVRIK